MKKCIMSIDCGTTGIRCMLFTHEGSILSQSYEEIGQIFPKPGWCEQNPKEIWDKCIYVMKHAIANAQVKSSDIEAIGITNQRATNILWNKKTGVPIYNAITWQDTRTIDMCTEKNKSFTMRGIRGLGYFTKQLSRPLKIVRGTSTGALLITASNLSISPATSLAHTGWILNNVEDAQQQAQRGELLFGTIDTWLIWNLTKGDTHATDYSNAGATNLFDSFKLKWSNLFLELFDIPEVILPEVRDTCGNFGFTEKRLLGTEIPITGAVADQQAALFAEGCIKPGDVKCTNGTGSFIDMNVGSRPPASMQRLIPLIAWSMKGKITYMLEGMINTTGAAIMWLKENLAIIDTVEESEALATSVEDSEGVYFVPAFTGLSSPYWDPRACGIVIGLCRKTRREHIVRAALEGIVYRCKDVLHTMESDTNLKISSIKADGGASRNNFLLQFMSDMIEVKVERPQMLDCTALGAAFFAGLSSGFWHNEKEILEKNHIDRIFYPSFDDIRRKNLYNGWKKAIRRSFKWAEYNR